MPESIKIVRKESPEAKRLPDWCKKPEDGDWVCMSAEIPQDDEADNDVVRVDGLSTSRHTSKSPIKLLGGHMTRGTSDGTPAIIGRMEEYKIATTSWKGKSGIPAMFGRFSWAKDGEGKITDLAGKYKALWDGGYLDSVSIGFRPIKSRALNAEKPWDGYEFMESELIELSIVTIPANPAATVLRAIADTFENKAIEHIENEAKELIAKFSDEQLEQFKSLITPILTRLDNIEDTIEVAAPKKHSSADDRTPVQDTSADARLTLAKAVDDLRAILNPTK